MKLLPSIELLSNTLNINKNLVQMNPIFEKHYNSIGYLYGSCLQPGSPIEVRQQHKRINIYEFSYKCKEWAHKKGFSYIGNNGLVNIHSSDNKIIAIINNNVENWFDIEIDIIACNWILENSK